MCIRDSHRVLEVSYNRDFQHVIIIQEYMREGSLKDMIYKMVGVGTVILFVIGNNYYCDMYRLGRIQSGQRSIDVGARDCPAKQWPFMEDRSLR